VVDTETSNLVVTGILISPDNERILHQVVYLLRKYSLIEKIYELYVKGLLVILHAFKEWYPW
jgi:hypothetical protein